jgi:hypothetical protein
MGRAVGASSTLTISLCLHLGLGYGYADLIKTRPRLTPEQILNMHYISHLYRFSSQSCNAHHGYQRRLLLLLVTVPYEAVALAEAGVVQDD